MTSSGDFEFEAAIRQMAQIVVDVHEQCSHDWQRYAVMELLRLLADRLESGDSVPVIPSGQILYKLGNERTGFIDEDAEGGA